MQPHQPPATHVLDNRRGRLSLQYLDECQQDRLRAGLRAVAGRSLYQWDEVQPHQADVLVLVPDQAGIRTTAPIKIWLGDEPPDRPGDGAFHLPPTFSTHTLWGVLDLIALRLMDTRRQPIGANGASLQDTTANDKPTYRLLKWVTLDARFQEPRFHRAMAGMTSRDVSLHWLSDQGGLKHEEARLLLRTLNQLGVLEINVRNQTVSPAPRAHAQAAHNRFFTLVERWLPGSRRPLHTGR